MSQKEENSFESQEGDVWTMLKVIWRECVLEAAEKLLWIETLGNSSWRGQGPACIVQPVEEEDEEEKKKKKKNEEEEEEEEE